VSENAVKAYDRVEVSLHSPLTSAVKFVWNEMGHAQKPDFVFRRNGRVHLNRCGRQFIRLLAAEVCASAVVILDTPSSGVVWRGLATYSIRQFPPSLLHSCFTVCHQVSNAVYDAHLGSLTRRYPLNRGVGALPSWSGLFGEEKVSCPLLEIKPRLLHRPSPTLGTTEGMTSPQTYSVHILVAIQQSILCSWDHASLYMKII
jgi:hypothetical protein